MSQSSIVFSKRLHDAIADLRPAFREVGQSLDQLTRRRAEIAPTFTRAYQLWRRETKRPFVAFVHELDPSMPVTDRNAYRTHRSYRAAQYLQQLVEQPELHTRHGLTPLSLLAVAVKSFLPACAPHQHEALLALTKASRWRERDVARLLHRIKRAKPISLPKIPRLVETMKATKAAVAAFEREQRVA